MLLQVQRQDSEATSRLRTQQLRQAHALRTVRHQCCLFVPTLLPITADRTSHSTRLPLIQLGMDTCACSMYLHVSYPYSYTRSCTIPSIHLFPGAFMCTVVLVPNVRFPMAFVTHVWCLFGG